jgi:hypothetical protein
VPPRRAQLTTASNLAFIFLIVTIVVAFVVLVVSGLVAAAFGRRRVRSSEMLGAS